MSDPVFIPVFGNSKEINERLAGAGMSDRYMAVPPLQIIFSGEGIGMQLDKEDFSKLSEDICFITISEDGNQDDVLSSLGLSLAPIVIPSSDEMYDDEIDEEAVLSAMEDDLEDDNPHLINKYRRFQETINRIQSAVDDDTEPGAVIIHSKGRIIDSMIYPGSGQSVFIVQFPLLYTSATREMDVPDVIPDPEAPISCMFNAFRVDGYTENAETDNNGEYLVVTDANALMFIETMTPCVVTSLSLVGDEIMVSSWMIHGESVDGVSPVVTEEIIDDLGDNLEEHVGVTRDSLVFKWPGDIPVNPFSLLAPVAADEEVIAILDSLDGDFNDE